MYEKSLKYLNMGFTGMFSVETILKIIGFGVKVGAQQQFDEWAEKARETAAHLDFTLSPVARFSRCQMSVLP